jgi:hypothetical protein
MVPGLFLYPFGIRGHPKGENMSDPDRTHRRGGVGEAVRDGRLRRWPGRLGGGLNPATRIAGEGYERRSPIGLTTYRRNSPEFHLNFQVAGIAWFNRRLSQMSIIAGCY